MKMTTDVIFKHMRPNLTTDQVQALYKLIEQGADIETIGTFAGVTAPKAVSKYQLSTEALDRLHGVKTELVNVVKRAIEISEVDFTVLEGVRTKERAYINYGKGRNATELAAKGVPTIYARPGVAKVTWLNNPLGSKHMTGDAVDLAPYPIDWNDLKRFDMVADAMFKAAKELSVKIRWGADWDNDGNFRERGETDSPHFEL